MVAIIAVLVAISIPIFTNQLEKAREATDMANIRAAYAKVVTAKLTDDAASAVSDDMPEDHPARLNLKSKQDILKELNSTATEKRDILVDFFRYAYGKHPQLWAGLAPYLSLQSGDVTLVQNAGIKKAFRTALLTDYRTTVSDQLEYMRMLYWDGLAAAMNTAGYHLGSRNVAISAALFSISVNCGPQPDVFIKGLDPSMSDPEMLDAIYRLRNTVFADQPLENRTKGTNDRYLIYEPEMAADLMFGRVNLDSWKIYGCGVEWYGNPF